jgi:5-methylcytosine-specific restriction endonuclease McrA
VRDGKPRKRGHYYRYACHEFGGGHLPLLQLGAIVAEAVGMPEPRDRDAAYLVFRAFFESDPKNRREWRRTVDRQRGKKQKRQGRPHRFNSNKSEAPDPTTDAFLRSFQWRQLRMVVLVKRGNRCECCGASPKDGITIHVDHIKPRRRFPELALVEANLQVLCEVCNHGKAGWDYTDWRTAGAQTPRESFKDSPIPGSGDGDGLMPVATRPRLVRRTQEGRADEVNAAIRSAG